MCDYSLEHVRSRPAAVADRLIVTAFARTITRGFSAEDDAQTAVCLLPGTEIAFDVEPRYEHAVTHWRVKAASRVARFRQVNMEKAHVHHDALEFADGTIVPLSRLMPGQRASVLQLPSVPLRTGELQAMAAPAGEVIEHL